MMKKHTVGIAAAIAGFMGCGTSRDVGDPLGAWNEGAAKQSIIEFVESVSDAASPAFIAPAERIAVFDNDGRPIPSGRSEHNRPRPAAFPSPGHKE